MIVVKAGLPRALYCSIPAEVNDANIAEVLLEAAVKELLTLLDVKHMSFPVIDVGFEGEQRETYEVHVDLESGMHVIEIPKLEKDNADI